MSDRPSQRFSLTRSLIAFLVAGSSASVFAAAANFQADDGSLLGLPLGSRLYTENGRPTLIAGVTLATGVSARASADAFLKHHAHLFSGAELSPGSLAGDGAAERPIMPEGDGGFRHTVVSYVQQVGEVPVFEAELRLLVRNDAGHAMVLASSTVKPLGDFAIAAAEMDAADIEGAFARVRHEIPELANADFDAPDFVVWAGPADTFEQPRLAMRFMAVVGVAGDEGYARQLIIADAADGSILLARDQILRLDINGTVRGMATEGYRSAFCNPEISMHLPFARITDGTTTVYADAAGAFVLPRANNTPVNVTASLRGRWFRVFSPSTDAPGLTLNSVAPPGPADFLFNAANTVEARRSEVNAYFHANFTRSQCLQYAPTFPTIGTQTEFRVNVELSPGTGFYDGTSINLGRSGSGIDSLAMADVVEHEYGHHLVARAGSGQGPYGEGFGDLMALLNSDSPINGRGYNGVNCNTGVRTADNAIVYPCSNADPHYCGQLLTGCFWELQDELLLTGDLASAREVMRPLAYNSVMMHQGDQVTPATVTEVILALDDTDGNVNNGTPHVFQILAGFGRKNMAVTLPNLTYSFPDGVPDTLTPGLPTPLRVRITPGIGQPRPETARVLVRDGNGSFVPYLLTPVVPGSEDYTGALPAFACGAQPSFYFAIDGASDRTFTSPSTAPATVYSAIVGSRLERFSDNGQSDQGWTISGPVVRGVWIRDVPVTNGTTGAPRVDGDGSGSCWITGNDAQDVDGSSTLLTSPRLDASGPLSLLAYSRWYYNSPANQNGTDTMLVEVSGDDGSTWSLLETVGPTGAETHGGWIAKQFSVPANVATDRFRVRFTARDASPDTTVEAGVDAVRLVSITCTPPCHADFNADGFLDFFDYTDFVSCFEGSCPPGTTADFNADGFADFFDYSDFVDAFEAGC